MQKNIHAKTSLRWQGAFCVGQCREHYIFEVGNLLTVEKQLVHGRRLKLFRNKYYEVTEELKEYTPINRMSY